MKHRFELAWIVGRLRVVLGCIFCVALACGSYAQPTKKAYRFGDLEKATQLTVTVDEIMWLIKEMDDGTSVVIRAKDLCIRLSSSGGQLIHLYGSCDGGAGAQSGDASSLGVDGVITVPYGATLEVYCPKGRFIAIEKWD